ncbi:MAG: ribosomal-processing cysteine protease Prp [Leptospiraceae bacterium]|nr:ribosomal-processing cysteine protease Prp [Leptospiraceae bacterium]MCK6380296.1 ribosomal-processing cysteine protease Prp [Leptospiraceae bacterium]NUM42189.1 ribosomal-processing cysteine protease Prp [Leptospiraceae bacterium]
MIEIWFKKQGNNYSKIKISGHSVTRNDFLKSEKIEEKIGLNVICAAVSILTQSLYIYCKEKGAVKSEKISNGLLEFELNKINSNTNTVFEMVEMGLLNLKIQYPKEILIEYLEE